MATTEQPAATRPHPAPPARPVPWGGREVGLVFACWLVLQATLATLAAASSAEPGLRASLAAGASANLLTALAIPPLLRSLTGASRADLGLRGIGESLRGVATGLAAALVVVPIILGIMAAASRVWPPSPHPMELLLRRDGSVTTGLLAVLGGVVLAPIAEELVFRGVLQGWFTRLATIAESGTTALPAAGLKANLLTSLIFAAIHLDQWPAPVPLFAFALTLGAVYRRTRNLAAPIALHAALNGVSTAWLLIGPTGPP